MYELLALTGTLAASQGLGAFVSGLVTNLHPEQTCVCRVVIESAAQTEQVGPGCGALERLLGQQLLKPALTCPAPAASPDPPGCPALGWIYLLSVVLAFLLGTCCGGASGCLAARGTRFNKTDPAGFHAPRGVVTPAALRNVAGRA